MIIRKTETHVMNGDVPVQIRAVYWFLIFPIAVTTMNFAPWDGSNLPRKWRGIKK